MPGMLKIVALQSFRSVRKAITYNALDYLIGLVRSVI